MARSTRTISILLACVMALFVAVSCASETMTTAPTTAPTTAGTTTETTPGEEKSIYDYEEMMEVTCAFYVGTAAPPDTENNPTVAYIREHLNIDISSAIFLAGENHVEKMGLMVASRDMPDVINFWTSPITTELVHQFADADMLLETESYFDHMPHITPNYTDLMIDLYRNPTDGNLYMVPSFSVNPDNKDVQYTIEPNLSLVARRDLMDQLGLEMPVTMDDFYNFLVAFNTLPDVDGKRFIPMQPLLGFDDFQWLIGAGFGIWKYRTVFNEEESRTIDIHETDAYLEFLKYAAKLYREGLVDPEMFTGSWEKTYERVGEGRVGAYVDWPNNIDTNNAAIQKNIPDAEYEALSVPRIPGLGSTEYWHTTTLGACTTIVSKDFPDPVRLMKFFDWMFTTEGWATVAWGAPGKEDGPWFEENGEYFWNKEVFNSKLKENPSFQGHRGGWVYFMVGQLVYLPEHIGLRSLDGKPSDPERLLARERNIDEVWMDQRYEIWQALPIGPVETDKWTAIESIFTTKRTQIVMEAKTDDEVIAEYNKMMDEARKAGLIEVLQERYAKIQAYEQDNQ